MSVSFEGGYKTNYKLSSVMFSARQLISTVDCYNFPTLSPHLKFPGTGIIKIFRAPRKIKYQVSNKHNTG